MTDHVRQPDCANCPLNGQPKVWGVGPLDAELLIVAEGPGTNEEEQGVPLVGVTGEMVNALLRTNGIDRATVRIENVIQCKATATSAQGRGAIRACGPSLTHLWQNDMPNLRVIVAFGEAALQEVSNYRASADEAVEAKKQAKAHAKAVAKYERAVAKYAERKRKQDERVAAGRKPGKPLGEGPVYPVHIRGVNVLPSRTHGWAGINTYRGSPLSVRTAQAKDVWLLPIIHPAATLPFRSPRLRPLLGLDFKKATGLLRRSIHVSLPTYFVATTREGVERFFAEYPNGPIALDIEWSRTRQCLVCIGVGGRGRYAILPASTDTPRDPLGDRMGPLQRALSDPRLEWGGHFVSGYDERKLDSVGLRLKAKWDTLYGFHICFSELGSSRDESDTRGDDTKASKWSQSTGYDLGFVSSVCTVYPYHKGVVTGTIDALDVGTEDLWTYCIGDVLRTYESWVTIAREFREQFPPDGGAGYRLLETEMECARIAAQMTIAGIPIRESVRQERLAEAHSRYNATHEKAKQIVGPEFNLNSTLQLARVLEASYGVRVRWNAKSGKPQLDGRVVQKLLDAHPDNPLLAIVGEARAAAKEIVAYEQLEPDSRGVWHPNWKVHGTVGSRWSSSPNAQNLSHQQREVIG